MSEPRVLANVEQQVHGDGFLDGGVHTTSLHPVHVCENGLCVGMDMHQLGLRPLLHELLMDVRRRGQTPSNQLC